MSMEFPKQWKMHSLTVFVSLRDEEILSTLGEGMSSDSILSELGETWKAVSCVAVRISVLGMREE